MARDQDNENGQTKIGSREYSEREERGGGVNGKLQTR